MHSDSALGGQEPELWDFSAWEVSEGKANERRWLNLCLSFPIPHSTLPDWIQALSQWLHMVPRLPWLEAQARLCLPSASEKDWQQGRSTSEGGMAVPTLCVADGTDNTSETTTAPSLKISLPCGGSKPICWKCAFSWLQRFLLMSCQSAAHGLKVLPKNKNPS